MAVSPGGSTLAVGSFDGHIALWSLTSGALGRSIRAHEEGNMALAFSASGRFLLSGGSDKRVLLWGMPQGRLRQAYAGCSGPVKGVAVSPDERMVVATSDGRSRLWRLRGGRQVRRAGVENNDHLARQPVASSPDGSAIATVEEGEAVLRDIASMSVRSRLGAPDDRHKEKVLSLAFDPAGGRLVIGSWDQAVRFWDVRSGKCTPLSRSAGHVYAVAFSLDARTVASGTSEGTAQLWNARSGRALHTLRCGSGVGAMAFIAGDRILVTACWSGVLLFWRVSDGQLLARAYSLDQGANWFVSTPDGRYDGSPGAFDLVRWHVGDRILPLAAIHSDHHVPGLLGRILGTR